MEKIYLIHARAQSGKDTAAVCIKNYYEREGKKVMIIAFADYVKFVLDKYYNTPHERSVEYRTRIQQFATDQVRHWTPNFWADTVAQLIYATREDFDVVVIPDWRFHNELAAISFFMQDELDSDETKLVKVLITREDNNSTDKMTEEQRSHQSECELDNYENFDYNIINKTNYLSDFYKQIEAMIKETENDSRE